MKKFHFIIFTYEKVYKLFQLYLEKKCLFFKKFNFTYIYILFLLISHDILLSESYDINGISNQSNIKIISSYAFSNYHNIRKFEILTNSNLQNLETYQMCSQQLKKFKIIVNYPKLSSFLSSCSIKLEDCFKCFSSIY